MSNPKAGQIYSVADVSRSGVNNDPVFWEVFNEKTNPQFRVEPAEKWTGEYVYFLHAPDLRRVKVGTSTRPVQRVAGVRHETGVRHLPLVLIGCLNGGRHLERLMHERFAEYHVSGEWFCDEILDEARALIAADAEFFGPCPAA